MIRPSVVSLALAVGLGMAGAQISQPTTTDFSTFYNAATGDYAYVRDTYGPGGNLISSVSKLYSADGVVALMITSNGTTTTIISGHQGYLSTSTPSTTTTANLGPASSASTTGCPVDGCVRGKDAPKTQEK